jgi:acetylornithine/N-succinyldiaminopimelate aminotransferase
MAVAKGIGGGFPLGACLAKGDVAKSMVPGTHGSTYGGNPLACTIGNAVLDRVLSPGFIENVDKMGQRLHWHLQQLQQKHPDAVLELRGKGLLAGIKLKDSIVVRDFVARLRDDHQLLMQGAGDNVLRFLPPLIITEADIEEAVSKISDALSAIESEAGKEHVTA